MREPLVSLIVPVLDEAVLLPGLLDRLAGLRGRFEVLVADGGSRDASAQLARAHPLGARVLDARRGRAAQLNAAAAEARGDVLLFLHADTLLPETAYASLASALADLDVVGGNFALRFEGGERFARFLELVYAVQRRVGVYYGDSALFVRAETFRALGGFRPLPVMEDFDFVRRLERAGRTVCLPGPAVTSSRRWRGAGRVRTLALWGAIQALFLLGVAPERLARLYRHVR